MKLFASPSRQVRVMEGGPVYPGTQGNEPPKFKAVGSVQVPVEGGVPPPEPEVDPFTEG